MDTPFTPEQIRDGCPAGRTVTQRVETVDGVVELSVSRFDEVDAEGAEIESWTERVDGTRSPSERSRSTWVQLQQHAAFPPDRTELDRVMLTTELGEMFCARYRVAGDQGVATFWFDLGRPGMPVAYDLPGRMTVTMIDDRRS